MGGFTISDLKKNLGPGLGLRSNKYLIELPIPHKNGSADADRKINILCRSTALPERNISTGTLYHAGRKFNVRGETEYPGTYEISVVDDSNMELRKMFDRWLNAVDLVSKTGENPLSDGEFTMNDSRYHSLAVGTHGAKIYQLDINIWQLDANNNKVYGYVLKSTFPSSLGAVTLDDGEENTLSQFSIVLTYSESIPIFTNHMETATYSTFDTPDSNSDFGNTVPNSNNFASMFSNLG